MKTLKFKNHLAAEILSGSKSVTWRIFDDKDLQVGDKMVLVNADTTENFADAEIIEVRERKLKDVSDSDFEFSGYKKENQGELLAHYQNIYGDSVNVESIIKMIKFKIIE